MPLDFREKSTLEGSTNQTAQLSELSSICLEMDNSITTLWVGDRG